MKSQFYTASEAVDGLKTIVVKIPIDPYNLLLERCESWRGEFDILKNGIITRDRDDQRQVEVRCNVMQAELLVDLANSVYPNAACHIKESIRRAKKP
jgi:hypothetical protein